MSVWAWGANGNGQLGLGFKSEQVSSPTLLKPEEAPSFSPEQVCGGADQVLILARKINHKNTPSISSSSLFQISDNLQLLDSAAVRMIACGFNSYFYIEQGDLFRQGPMFSSGLNVRGILGRRVNVEEVDMDKKPGGEIRASNFLPWGKITVPEDPSTTFGCVAVGLRHAIAIGYSRNRVRSVYVWGDNSKHQIGLENEGVRLRELPERLAYLDGLLFNKIACGKDFTIAADSAGSLYGCGQNRNGVLLHAPQDITEFRHFTRIFDLFSEEVGGEIEEIACGWSHVLVLLNNGVVLSWGRNDLGQLGRISVNPEFDVEPGVVKFPFSKKDWIISIKCGSEHCLALSEGGTVYAWGWNEHDNCGVQLGEDKLKEQAEMFETAEGLINEDSKAWRKDCIRLPVVVPIPVPEFASIKAIGCGPGGSFAFLPNFSASSCDDSNLAASSLVL